jgi:hypothetical protein
MKKPHGFLTKAVIYSSIIVLLPLIGCSKKTPEQKNVVAEVAAELPPIIIDGKPVDLTKYYDAPEFKECYNEPIAPPPLNLNVEVSSKPLADLRLLRNEIYARHGYLFKDMVLRGYFLQYKWYQPIYWDSLFKVTLSKEEGEYVSKIQSLEQMRLKENYVKVNNRMMGNYQNIVNTVQFKEIPDTLASLLKSNGFALVKGNRRQLFHVYDENQYDAIPHYVTVDLYLQLLHVYYSNLLRKIENEKLIPALKEGLTELQNRAIQLYTKTQTTNMYFKDAARFNAIYFSVARAVIEGKTIEIPNDLHKDYQEELERINSKVGFGSPFLKSKLFDYTQLQPRGYYANDSALSEYFVCLRWLELAPMFVSDDDGMASAIVGAYLLQQGSGQIFPQYKAIDGVARILVGEPNNLSLSDVVALMAGINTPDKLATCFEPKNMNELKAKLKSMNHARIVHRAASKLAEGELKKTPLFFMSARYTFDGEILQRLVHVLRPEPKRPFPKGLDIFAVFGNKEAEKILFETYNEKKNWPAYPDSLAMLKKTFSSFLAWDQNAYTKRMQTVFSILNIEPSFPVFMQTPEWQRRSLNTALAGWTHLKHETVLYTFPPGGAECGDGGCAPPPDPIGYVEPNVSFWKNAVDLLDLTFKGLKDIGCESASVLSVGEEIKESISLMRAISEKELSKKALSKDEFDDIHSIGGKIESLTMKALDAQTLDDSPDRRMPIATDVYTFNDECLQEATGLGNEIYVIAEINGLLYITRGAVLSYYEFLQPSSNRLTDKAWQERLDSNKVPVSPVWLDKLFAPIKKLETKPTYNSLLPGGC